MPKKIRSFTRFLRKSSNCKSKAMAKLSSDEKISLQLRSIAGVSMCKRISIVGFLQIFLVGVVTAMTVMTLFWSSKHAHLSVASLSDNLEDSWISILESTDVSAVHLGDLLSSNVSRGNRASLTNDVASAQVSVGVVLHNGIWGHIAISTAIILSICRLARAAKKVMQLCAALLQQRQVRKRAESMNNHKSSDTHEIVLCNELRCNPLLAKGDQDAVSEMTEKNQRIRDQKPLFEELGVDIECIEKRVYAICLVSEHPQNSVWRNQGNDLSKEMLSSCILSRDCEENGLVDKARKQKEEGEGKTIVLPMKTNAAGVGEASYVSDTQAHLSIASTNTFVAVEHVIGHSSATSNGPQKEEVDGSRIKAAYHRFLENGLVDKAKNQKEEGEGKTIVSPTKTNAAGVGEASYVQDRQAHLSIASTNTFVAVEHVIGHSNASSNGPQKEEVDGSQIKAAYYGFLENGLVDKAKNQKGEGKTIVSPTKRNAAGVGEASYVSDTQAHLSIASTNTSVAVEHVTGHSIAGSNGPQKEEVDGSRIKAAYHGFLENGLVDKAKNQKKGEGKTIVSPTKTNAAGVGEASYVSDTQAHLSIDSTNTSVAVEHVIGHSIASSNGPQKEEVDGSRIKAAYHGFLAREALRVLDRLAKLKLSGQVEPVQKEAATAPHCVQALARVQAPARACCASAVDYQDRFDHKTYVQKLEAGWCDKLGSVDAIQKEERRRQETAPTHQKAKSSAFAHQWKPHPRINYRQSGRRKSDGTNKGCNWLGCGMATYSWKTKGHLDAAKMDGSESISSSILDPLMDSVYEVFCFL